MFPNKNMARGHWVFLLVCISASISVVYGKCGNPGDIENGDLHISSTEVGAIVNYTCHAGYKMISRRNYRECLPDNTWSNEAPVCEIQSCIPPYPIADGSFYPNKEEYEYQNTVTYQCSSKRFALIGESSVSCTVHGNWSSKPPECVVVECSSPNVDNAVKLSGFTGPYYFNNAVRFECLPKFTMNGSGLVKCNVRSQWEPPLPTCYSNVPAVMGNCIVILTLMLFGHLLGHHA